MGGGTGGTVLYCAVQFQRVGDQAALPSSRMTLLQRCRSLLSADSCGWQPPIRGGIHRLLRKAAIPQRHLRGEGGKLVPAATGKLAPAATVAAPCRLRAPRGRGGGWSTRRGWGCRDV